MAERFRLSGPRREKDGSYAGALRVEVRCRNRRHLLGSVRATSVGLLWQSHDFNMPEPPDDTGLAPLDRDQYGRFKASRRELVDFIAILADRPDPNRALGLFCRCGDLGDISRADLLAAANEALRIRRVVRLVR